MLEDPTLAASGGSGSMPQGEDGVLLRRGDSLDRFVVIGELGRGAMGTVYAAFDTKLERQVAVKLLHGPGRGIDSLLAEAQALARINHPNVVTVHDVGEHEGRLFLAMELVRGRTLREFQRASGRHWRDILDHYRQAARGLAAVHAANLVHGDFKPENVMVAEDGRVLVMDFGIARTLDAGDSANAEAPSSSGARSIEVSRIRGTPAYMAPEQFSLDPVGPLSDQFGFCVALHEGLWGRRPFEGTTLAELAQAVSSGSRRARPSRSPVPRWLEPIIDRGLSHGPQERFESMLALDDAFDASLRRRMKGFSLLGATGLTAIVALAVALPAGKTDACDDPADALREQLSGPGIGALKKRIADIEHPDAPAASAQFERQLDAFSRAWFAANAALCTPGSAGPEIVAARRNCLERQRDGLRAVSDAFSDVADFDLARASNLSSALPRPENCSELEDLDAPEGTGSDVLIDAQQRLATARALRRAGLPHDGPELAAGILSDLEGIDAPRLKANIHLWTASQLRFARRYDEALRETRAAQVDAALSGDDDLQVLGWLDRTYHTQSAAPTDLTLMRAQLEAAELALVRAGDPPELRIRYLMREAGLQMSSGKPRDAVASMDEALTLSKTAPPRARVLSNIYNLRAIAFIQVDDKTRAQADFQQAHDVLEQAYGSYHPTLSQSRNNLGAVCMELGDLECARSTLEKARRSLEASSQPNLPSKATLLATLANLAYFEQRLEDAQALARESLTTAQEGELGGHDATVTATAVLLRALARLENWEDGALEVQRLLAWNEQHRGTTAKSAQVLLLVARFYQDKGEFSRALDFVQRARSVRERHAEAPDAELVDARRQEADLLRELGRLDEAESALVEAEAMLTKLKDAPSLTQAKLELARILLTDATGQTAEATALALAMVRTFDAPDPDSTELREKLASWMHSNDVVMERGDTAIAR